MPQEISIRAYAKQIGLSNHQSLLNAIAQGKLPTGYNQVTKKINPEKADAEYGNTIKAKRGITTTMATMQDKAATQAAKIFTEMGLQPADAHTTPGSAPGSWNGGAIPHDITFVEALRIEMILKARQKLLQTEELTGLLVRKTEIDNQMSTAGMEIRKALQRYPSIVIDNIRAATTRHEALRYAESEIEKILFETIKIINDKIIKDDNTPIPG